MLAVTSQPLAALSACTCKCLGNASRPALSPKRSRQLSLKTAAEPEEASNSVLSPSKVDQLFASGSGKITGALKFRKDTETFRDVFNFAGELPERLNGRLAQWAFAALMLTEWQSGGQTTVVQQAAAHPFAVASFSFTILLASLAPKFASGVSLKDLHGSCSKENLPKVLTFFNKTHELWLGRIAMIGITGLAVLETVKGSPLIGG